MNCIFYCYVILQNLHGGKWVKSNASVCFSSAQILLLSQCISSIDLLLAAPLCSPPQGSGQRQEPADEGAVFPFQGAVGLGPWGPAKLFWGKGGSNCCCGWQCSASIIIGAPCHMIVAMATAGRGVSFSALVAGLFLLMTMEGGLETPREKLCGISS